MDETTASEVAHCCIVREQQTSAMKTKIDDRTSVGSSSSQDLLATELRAVEEAAPRKSVILDTIRDAALQGAHAIEVQVEQLVPVPSIALVYRIGRILCVGVSIIACLVPWCVYLIEPRAVVTLDSEDAVRVELAKWDSPLSLARAALPRILTAVLGPLLMALCAECHFHSSRTMIGELLEQGFKSLFPFFLGLPLVGLTLQQLPMRVDPVMSAWDLQRDLVEPIQELKSETVGAGSFTRTNTSSTILRRSMLPTGTISRKCTGSTKTTSGTYTDVSYEFMTNEWQKHMLPRGLEPLDVYWIPQSSDITSTRTTKTSFTTDEVALLESSFIRAAYLYVDSVLQQDALSGGANSADLEQLKLDTLAYYELNHITNTSITSTDLLQQIKVFVRNYFSDSPVWTSVLQARVAEIQVEYATFVISDTVNFTSVTLEIPLENAMWYRQLEEVDGALIEKNTTWPGSGDVTYEIDVAKECGPSTCGMLNRGLSPDPQVVAYGVCPRDGSDCSRSADKNALWLFGFGRQIEGDTFQLEETVDSSSLRKAIVRNPRETHRVATGMLTVHTQALDQKFSAKCSANDPKECTGLSFPLNTTDSTTNTTQYLLLSHSKTGIMNFQSGFDLKSVPPRGRPLVTRYTTGVRAEFEVVQQENFASSQWNGSLRYEQCSASMERTLGLTMANHLFIEHPLQVTYTAGLFFLFDNARLVTQLPASLGNSLDMKLNIKSIDIALVVPLWQALLCLLLCLVLVSHCLVLYVKSHKHVSGSVDKLQQPEVLVRALADSSTFPHCLVSLQVQSEDKTVNLTKVPLHSIEFGPFSISENGFFVRKKEQPPLC